MSECKGCSMATLSYDGEFLCGGDEDCKFTNPDAWKCRDEYGDGPCAIYDDTEFTIDGSPAAFDLSKKLIDKSREKGIELIKITDYIVDQYRRKMVVFEWYKENVYDLDIVYRYVTETIDGEVNLKFVVRLKEEE